MTTKDNNTLTPAAEPANKYTPDAQQWMTRLRSLAAEFFPNETGPKRLTIDEVRLARSTTVAALENAALFVEAAPDVGKLVAADPVEMRDAIAFEMAYGGVREEARALVRHIDLAILRRKMQAVRSTREVYRVAKGFITADAGDAVRPHVAEMKRVIAGRRRKTPTPTTPTTTKQ